MKKISAYHIKSLKIDKGTTICIYIHHLKRIFEKKNIGIEYQPATKYTPQ